MELSQLTTATKTGHWTPVNDETVQPRVISCSPLFAAGAPPENPAIERLVTALTHVLSFFTANSVANASAQLAIAHTHPHTCPHAEAFAPALARAHAHVYPRSYLGLCGSMRVSVVDLQNSHFSRACN